MKKLFLFISLLASATLSAQLPEIPRQPVIGHLIENEGQILDTDDSLANSVKYYTSTAGAMAWFLNDRVTHSWFRDDSSSSNVDTLYRMDARFDDCNSTTPWVNQLDTFRGTRNYFLGYLPANITGVHSYKKLLYQHLYDSISAELSSNGPGLNYRFKLSPGANYNDINIVFDSASSVTYDTIDGTITATTPYGGVRYFRPYAYTYNLTTSDTMQFDANFYYDGSTLSLQLYADTNTFMDSIIPAILPVYIEFSSVTLPSSPLGTPGGSPTLIPCDYFIHWSTYFGGLNDRVGDNYVDDANYLYTAGSSDALLFPVTPGSFQGVNNGMTDAVVARFDPSRHLVYATFYGGTDRDVAYGVTANNIGEAIFTGYTNSTITFFVANYGGYYDGTHSGGSDAFVVRLRANGSSPVFATFFGGSAADIANAIAFDINNNFYIGGITSSTSTFPIQNLSGAYNQGTNAGMYDAFIAKFDATDNLTWSTFLGGPYSEGINGMTTLVGTVLGADLYVKGSSLSDGSLAASPCSENDNPATIGTTGEFPLADPGSGSYVEANATTGGTNCDVFVCKFLSSGLLEWSTMYGGAGNDATQSNSDVGGISVSANGTIFITGTTASTSGFPMFPTTAPPSSSGIYWDDTHSSATFDAYIAKFIPNLPFSGPPYFLKYSTYYGITGNTYGTDVVAGDLFTYFTGYTYGTISTNPNLPGIFFNSTSAGSADGYFFVLDEQLVYVGATYFGGSGADHSLAMCGIQLGSSVDIILSGLTTSTIFNPLEDPGIGNYYQPILAGIQNGFITELRTICALRSAAPNFDNKESSDLVLFPNPNTGSFTISLTRDFITQLEIYNVLGEKVFMQDYSGTSNLADVRVEDFCEGIYYIVISGLSRNYSTKVILK